jgi:hypothetical protein
VILTVKGKAAAIVQDAEAYQRLLDIAADADAGRAFRTRKKERLGPPGSFSKSSAKNVLKLFLWCHKKAIHRRSPARASSDFYNSTIVEIRCPLSAPNS